MLFGKYPGGVIAVLGSRGEGGRDAWTDRGFVPGGLFEVLRRLSGTGLHSRYTQRRGVGLLEVPSSPRARFHRRQPHAFLLTDLVAGAGERWQSRQIQCPRLRDLFN